MVQKEITSIANENKAAYRACICLLYTSDAADE